MTTDNSDAKTFKKLAPQSYIDRAQINSNDPLLLQVIPSIEEEQSYAGYNEDPLMEKEIEIVPGLLHKYYGRVLLLVTNECAIHCRFCFRRHQSNIITDWDVVLNYIATKKEISEVILSGGDPLMLSAVEIKNIIANIAAINHVKHIRIHSRIPIVDPSRITATLCTIFAEFKLPIVLVVHCNHPNEINAEVINAINELKKVGVIILNQTVLLKNVNDDVDILVNLSEKLLSAGILPYYLHMLDKVQGAAHFYIDDIQAKEIWQKMREKLPGYLVPRLVRDEIGRPFKVQV